MAAMLPKAALMSDELALLEGRAFEEAAGIAGMMGAGGWMWPLILTHMGLKPARQRRLTACRPQYGAYFRIQRFHTSNPTRR